MKQFNNPISRHHLLLFLILITQVIPFSDCCHDDERNALLTFKSFVTDPLERLLSWQVGTNCCNWFGIRCSNNSLHVVNVDLHLNDHSGAISPSLLTLSHLQYLDLSTNFFIFPKTPYQFDKLKHLTHLDISDSGFSGSIPKQFVKLSSLRYLNVSCYVPSCSVSSTDTSWLRGLTNLKELRLRGVHLNSTIPIQLSKLNSLSVLDLDNSQLQAGSLSYLPHQLKELHIRENPNLGINLISLISNASLLKYLDASRSSIQGSLSSIINLSRLEYLSLNDNNITGQIPSSVSNLKNLKYLDLSGNNLQGPIPESICEISSLKFVDLGRNNFTGTIPSCILKLGNLT